MKMPSLSMSPKGLLALSPICMIFGHALLLSSFRDILSVAVFCIAGIFAAAVTITLVRVRDISPMQPVYQVLGFVISLSLISLWFVTSGAQAPTRAKTIACLVPLIWSGAFSFLFLVYKRERDQIWKLPAYCAAAMIGLSVCLIVWHLGGQQYAVTHPAGERFPYTFKIWDTQPIYKHFFLGFDARWAQFGQATYHGYTSVYMMFFYIALKIINAFTGLDYAASVRFSSFIYGIQFSLVIPAVFLYVFPSSFSKRFQYLALLMVSVVLLVSIPDLWLGTLTYDGDNLFPISALFHITIVALLFRIGPTSSKAEKSILYSILVLHALFTPLPAAFFAVGYIFYALSEQDRFYLRSAIFLLLISIAVYGAQGLVARIAGFSYSGSSFLFRSGLDGSVAYFTNMYNSFFNPGFQTAVRGASFVLIGAGAWLMTFVVQFFVDKSTRTYLPATLLFAPFLLSLGMFPQAHAIHPYLYDLYASILGLGSLLMMLFAVQSNPGHTVQRWLGTFMTLSIAILMYDFTQIIRFFISSKVL